MQRCRRWCGAAGGRAGGETARRRQIRRGWGGLQCVGVGPEGGRVVEVLVVVVVAVWSWAR